MAQNINLENTPPHDFDSERAVLGALLREPELCDDVVFILRDADDFYHDAHRRIYRQMMKMRSVGSSIDLLQLVKNLQAAKELELTGGHVFLAELMTNVPVTVHAKHYAKTVKDKATLRKLLNTSIGIIRDVYAPETQVKDLLNKAALETTQLCESQTVNQITDMTTLMRNVLDQIEARRTGVVDGIKTGFVDLDNLIGGLHPSELVILAARPGEGKTALALNIATNVATRGNAVLFVSLEMSGHELGTRLLCSQAKLDGSNVRNKTQYLSRDEIDRLVEASMRLEKAPLRIDDTPSRTITEIAAVARRLKRQENLTLLVIDYLGLITPENPKDIRQEQVAKIARHLKLLSRELKIPILCLAQLNRQADTGRNDRPRLSQLRESGAIEQDADVVMFIHRKETRANEEQTEDEDNRTELIIAKQRNGATGDIKLIFQRDQSRFGSEAEHRLHEFDEFG